MAALHMASGHRPPSPARTEWSAIVDAATTLPPNPNRWAPPERILPPLAAGPLRLADLPRLDHAFDELANAVAQLTRRGIWTPELSEEFCAAALQIAYEAALVMRDDSTVATTN